MAKFLHCGICTVKIPSQAAQVCNETNDDYTDDDVEEAADDHDDDHVDVDDGLVSSLFHTKFTPDCR